MSDRLAGKKSDQNTGRSFPAVRFPMRVKITLPFLVLSLILALAGAFITTQLVIENIDERFNKQLFEAGKIASELMVDHESELLKSYRLLSNIEGVPEALSAGDPNQLRLLTFGAVANEGQDVVEFINTEGMLVLSLHHVSGGNPEDYASSTGSAGELTRARFVHKVLEGNVDEQGNKFAGLYEDPSGAVLYVSGPVYNSQGRLTGALLVGRSLSELAFELGKQTFSQVTFYDMEGNVVSSTLPHPLPLAQEMIDEALNLEDTNTPVRDMESSNIAFRELTGVWRVRSDEKLGFVGVAISKDQVLKTSNASRWQIFTMVAAAFFLIILIGFNLANSITRPLVQLVQASVRVARGDLNVKVESDTQDEISILTESFNAMVDSVHRSQNALLKAYDSTLAGWAKALELRDKETEGHSERVTNITVRLSEAMGLSGDILIDIRRGALLHDIGKMGVPDAILHKPGKLTSEEAGIIHKHPLYAYEMLKDIDYLKPALMIPICHHEHWDGTGYPQGLKGEMIPLPARIFAVVDVWDALSNDRPYRKAWSVNRVIEYLQSQSGTQFDPKVVDAFLKMLRSNGNG